MCVCYIYLRWSLWSPGKEWISCIDSLSDWLSSHITVPHIVSDWYVISQHLGIEERQYLYFCTVKASTSVLISEAPVAVDVHADRHQMDSQAGRFGTTQFLRRQYLYFRAREASKLRTFALGKQVKYTLSYTFCVSLGRHGLLDWLKR